MNKEPRKNDNNELHINFTLAIVIIVTLALFVVGLIAMTVSLIVDNVDSGSAYVEGGGGGGGGGGSSQKQPNVPASASDVGEKTGIALPCATAEGAYLSSAEGATDISTDTDIKSGGAVLVDITDNKTVALKNADVKIYPASMTKVMTLLVACENAKDPNALLTVTAEMVAKYNLAENTGASIAFTWEEGYQVTVEDALHMVIYKSDTYACWLLAEYVSGSEEAFVTLMNNKAKSLGLTATNFTNCTGLYNSNHYTTCRELAAIMAAAMNNTAATAVLTKTAMFTADIYKGGEKSSTVEMWSDWYTGRLEAYRWGAAAAHYAGNGSDIKIIAGKTGWETVPTSCFVTSAFDDVTGRKYVCVQVGRISEDQDKITTKVSTDDTRLIYQKYAVED